MKRKIPRAYRAHLEDRQSFLKDVEGRAGLSPRGFWVGAFLSLYLAIGAPYVRMAIRATVMAFDYNTPGAIFLFLVLVGLLNVLFKVTARSRPCCWQWPLRASSWAGTGRWTIWTSILRVCFSTSFSSL